MWYYIYVYKSKGKLVIDNGLRIVCGYDFILYYKWLIDKYFYNTQKLQLPAHGSHITIINPNIHNNFTYQPALPYIGKDIEFTYNPLDIYESKVNFWLPIQCPLADKIKKMCGAVEKKNWYGNHLTICNRKFND